MPDSACHSFENIIEIDTFEAAICTCHDADSLVYICRVFITALQNNQLCTKHNSPRLFVAHVFSRQLTINLLQPRHTKGKRGVVMHDEGF